jgi:hypothetical protein
MNDSIRAALENVALGLEGGHYRHVPIDDATDFVGDVAARRETGDGARLFSMAMWATPGRCGTVCCIGGWLEVEIGRRLTRLEEIDVYPLTYGSISGIETPAEAAAAIRRFLAGSREPWHA